MSLSVRSTHSNLHVLFEDNHLIVVNKRPGDIVQGDKTGDVPLSDVVKTYLKTKYDKPGNVYLGVVHRLDRPTSGILVFAKTSKALPRLNKLFSEGKTKKVYWAVVTRTPPKDRDILVHWLVRNPKQNKSYAHSKEVSNGKKAILEYKVIKKLDNHVLLEIDLKTGRHHQIRAQLATIGSTIKGDLKYGAPRSNKDGSIHLHARTLTLEHPVKKQSISFVAPPPEDAVWKACP
ncbi:RNA pseudouridine synthase [Muricauda sp. SCSIO 64092]|uniref:RluA family pseudouridine synthase n=1 Tax=Allomuricauda sp. SCSIO 64092 TaxID=2908842 RepID=UPI001FF2FCBD|nr:RNA pseudouridine synthase [Muricauda sp. SCSIO 64092]UOY06879.1 RNA pseudouridine synthase [Muricauda sp. SCSIO 64092]